MQIDSTDASHTEEAEDQPSHDRPHHSQQDIEHNALSPLIDDLAGDKARD
jgi:hypothetical protein